MVGRAEGAVVGLDYVSGRDRKESLEQGRAEAGGTKESGQGPG